ncbi:unnamed protein product [Taenia asiatica]|uniref:Cilia- and flagella-associated protein 157 n=1 Tax=Taenia asiatica TaxID=60517 RepID=A0A0R3W164_TAEAS|nr:unnamed protein product [Taenia asiatica]
MEKLSREARNDIEERMHALNLWEKTVMRTQNRGEEIDALLQVITNFDTLWCHHSIQIGSVEALSRRINAKLRERNERERCLRNAVRDTSERTTRLEKFEKHLEVLRKKHSNLQDKMKNTYSQEQKSANNKRIRIDNLIRNCKSELKKLNNQICIEEDKVTHQERTIYDQDLKILQIESRLSKLQDEVSLEEIEEYQKGIQHLSAELERLSRVQKKLATELEVLQVNLSLQLKRDLNEKLVALTMSRLQSKKDQKAVEAHARAYLAAADITTGPRPSWVSVRDTNKLLSGASSTGTSCPNTAITAKTLPNTTR